MKKQIQSYFVPVVGSVLEHRSRVSTGIPHRYYSFDYKPLGKSGHHGKVSHDLFAAGGSSIIKTQHL